MSRSIQPSSSVTAARKATAPENTSRSITTSAPTVSKASVPTTAKVQKTKAPPAAPTPSGVSKTSVAPKKTKPMKVEPTRSVPRLKPQPAIRNRQDAAIKLPAMREGRLKPSDQIRERLKLKSPWYQAIEDPLNHGGCKIPDAFGTSTATNQMVFDTSVTINAQGVAGARILCPYPNNQENGVGIGSNYQITSASSTAADLDWGNGTATNASLAFPNNSTFVGFAQGCRVVSACVIGMPEMSTLSDAGEMVATVVPFSHITSMSYSDYVSYYDSSTIALNKHKSLRASWYPAEMIDPEGYSRDYRDFISVDIVESSGQFPYWEMAVVLTGASANSGKLRVRMIVNLEWVPIYNAFDVISPAPSPVDIEEEEFVCAEMQSRFPVTRVVTDKYVSSAPTSAPVQSGSQNDTGFGFFAEILKELGPMVLKALV